MQINVGGIDRVLRIVIGIVLITLAISGVIGSWGWIGILPLLTGVFRFCPGYWLSGFSSCKTK